MCLFAGKLQVSKAQSGNAQGKLKCKNECALFACSETAGKLHLTVVQTRADGWTWARSVTHASSLLHYAAYNLLLATYIVSYKLLLALLQRILALGVGKHGQ